MCGADQSEAGLDYFREFGHLERGSVVEDFCVVGDGERACG